MHGAHVSKYTQLTTEARKRKTDRNNDGSVKRMKQQQLQSSFSNANLVSQHKVDQLILNFVTHGLLPLRIVELPEFVQLVTGLQPNRTVVSRATLRRNVTELAGQKRQKLITILKEQAYVATTTDCWSSHGKSYIGITVHWIESDTLERKSACLALRRMKGSHTFDVIASVLEDIHTEFGIRRKIVMTTTDNGSNFVKAFSVFGETAKNSIQDNADEDVDNEEDSSDSESVDVYDVSRIFTDNDAHEYHLPRHQRCACHTLNLISTADADKAESDATYKKISRSAFAKCQGLWNKYGRSSVAVEAVIDTCGLGLKKPNQTRWNSVFLAVERLLRLVSEKGEDVFHSMCTKLEVPRLTNGELAFLTEYASVMKPLAQALNILQCEKKTYMAYLLPTITILREKLVTKKSEATMCKPLVSALLYGIDQRFSDLFGDSEAMAAAILHPKFRTGWTDDKLKVDQGLQHIKHLLVTMHTDVVPADEVNVGNAASSDDDDGFFTMRKNVITSNSDILDQ